MADWNIKLSAQPQLPSRKKKDYYPKNKSDIKLLKTSEQSFQMIFLSMFHGFKEKKKGMKLIHLRHQWGHVVW